VYCCAFDSRNGAQGEDFDGGQIKSVKIVSSSKGKSTEVDAKFIITDTRMQVSSARVKSKGSSKSQDFSYISRKKVQTELEFWILKTGKFSR
jgi:hypothetical protein